MSFQVYGFTLDVQLIGNVADGIVLLYVLYHYGKEWYDTNMGKVYRVRICTFMNGRFKQTASKLVPIHSKTFNIGKSTYSINPDNILFFDPAPVLIYTSGDAISHNLIGSGKGYCMNCGSVLNESKLILSAKKLFKLIKEQVVAGMIKSSIRPAFDYTNVFMGIGIGISIGWVLKTILKV